MKTVGVAACVLAVCLLGSPAGASTPAKPSKPLVSACLKVESFADVSYYQSHQSYTKAQLATLATLGRLLAKSHLQGSTLIQRGDASDTAQEISAALHAPYPQQAGVIETAAHTCEENGIGMLPPPPVTVPTTTPGPIFNQSGSGIASTTDFSVPSEWDLSFSYDCSGAGGMGNFIVNVHNSDSTADIIANGVNELGASGSSVEHYHADPGRKYLEINSECNWTVSVTPA